MDLRLFIAIETDHAGRRAMGKLVERIRGLPGRIRWCTTEQMHLTLSFLGTTPAEQVVEIAEAMGRAAATGGPFPFTIQGLGAFPDLERPRVFWLGVAEPSGTLLRLQQRLTDELADLGFAPESRAYAPHITLGRVKQPDRRTNYTDELFNYLDFTAPPQMAGELKLFSSDLTSDGSVYQIVAHAALGRSGGSVQS